MAQMMQHEIMVHDRDFKDLFAMIECKRGEVITVK